jgi:hypothetical protein
MKNIWTSGRSNEYHFSFCALRNTREALYFVLFSTLMVFLTGRDLGNPLGTRQSLFMLVFGHLIVLVFLVRLFALLGCFRERLVLALAMAWLVIGLISGLPSKYLPASALLIRGASFLLWVVALAVSVSMLASARRKRNTQLN